MTTQEQIIKADAEMYRLERKRDALQAEIARTEARMRRLHGSLADLMEQWRAEGAAPYTEED
jgi:peptidoglycan hydrolase CwlO-like protein